MRLRSTTPKDHLHSSAVINKSERTCLSLLPGSYLPSWWNVYHPLCILDAFPCSFWEVTIQMPNSHRVRSIQTFTQSVNFVRV
jgi:hypothetical protein